MTSEQTATAELPVSYPIEVVALRVGLPVRRLLDDVRAERFEHLHYGRERRMTEAQVLALLDAITRKPVEQVKPDPLAATRARVARQRQRRGSDAA